MADFSLKPEDFEELFSLDNDDFNQKLPTWIEHVQPIEVSVSVGSMIEELRKGSKTTARLERALRSACVPIPQDIPYREAKQKVEEITTRLQSVTDMGDFDKLSQELEKYSTALMASDEYLAEMAEQERVWEEEHAEENRLALIQIRRHMPTNIRLLSEAALHEEHGLPKPIARKFKRTNVLQLLRVAPADIVKVHPSMLDQYKTTGLTLTERRALHAHLLTVGPQWEKLKDPSSERKFMWFGMLKNKFREMAGVWDRHVTEHGSPSATHKCQLLGNQCPFKANAIISYNNGDFGFPGNDEYEIREVTTATETPLPSPFPREKPKATFLSELSTKNPAKPSFLSELSSNPKPSFSSELATKAPNKQQRLVNSKVTGNSKPLMSDIFAQKNKVLKLASDPHSPPLSPEREKTSCQSPLPASLKVPGAPPSPLRKLVRFSPKLEATPPKNAEEQRQLHIEEHYSAQPPKRFSEAKESYAAIKSALDLIESSLNDWIGRMLAFSKTGMKEDEKKQQNADFLVAIRSVQAVVNDLSERTKWTARSAPECEIAEDLVNFTKTLSSFVLKRMKEMPLKDKNVKKSLKEVVEALDKIHDRNLKSLKKLGVGMATPTRKVRKISEMAQDIIKEKKKKKKERREKKEGKKKATPGGSSESLSLPQSPPETSFVENCAGEPNVATYHFAVPVEQESSTVVEQETSTVIEQETPTLTDSSSADKPGTDDSISVVPKAKPPHIEDPSVHGYQTRLVWQLARQVQSTQKTNRRLEKAMTNAGVAIPDESIPYQEAEKKVKELSQQMNSLGFGHPEYFKLEQEMEKYSSALLSSEEYKKELERREKEWEERVSSPNREALARMRSYMPVDVRNLSEKELVEMTTPNGKKLPKEIARKFKRSNVLQLLRLSPRDIEQLHFANLEALSLSGLLLVERRALYEHLRPLGPRWEKNRSDQAVERKLMWYNQMKIKLKQELQKWEEHIESYGLPPSHQCQFPGNQCLVKANSAFDYQDDFGFPTDETYMVVEVAKEEICNLAEQARQESSAAVKQGMDYWGRRT